MSKDHNDYEYDLLGMAGGYLLRTHSEDKCELDRIHHGYPCSIHAPSDHPLSGAPLHWRQDRGLMERICPHGIGHPDPDDLAHKKRVMGASYENHCFGVHGCDGCCRGRKIMEPQEDDQAVKYGKLCAACSGTGFEPDSPAMAATIEKITERYGYLPDRVREIVNTYLAVSQDHRTQWDFGDPEPPRGIRLRDRDDDIWNYNGFEWVAGDNSSGHLWESLEKRWFPMTKVDDGTSGI